MGSGRVWPLSPLGGGGLQGIGQTRLYSLRRVSLHNPGAPRNVLSSFYMDIHNILIISRAAGFVKQAMLDIVRSYL
jgi:hypothetical protein